MSALVGYGAATDDAQRLHWPSRRDLRRIGMSCVPPAAVITLIGDDQLPSFFRQSLGSSISGFGTAIALLTGAASNVLPLQHIHAAVPSRDVRSILTTEAREILCALAISVRL